MDHTLGFSLPSDVLAIEQFHRRMVKKENCYLDLNISEANIEVEFSLQMGEAAKLGVKWEVSLIQRVSYKVEGEFSFMLSFLGSRAGAS